MLREELAGYAEYAAKVRYRLIPALIYLAITVRVTAIEDQMLRDELNGYAEYAAKVRYCLIPGVW